MSAGAAFALETGLQALGFERAQSLAQRLLEFADLLLDSNTRTNLVGAKSIEALIAAHLLDSLAPLAHLPMAQPILDVGSGAGLPGIPVALAWPRRRVVLMEPRAKRALFLRTVASALDLSNVEIVQTTAEKAARGPWRAHAGTALSRALARAPRALELVLPLLRRGGIAVLYLGRLEKPGPEERAVLKLHGARVLEARRVVVPYLDAQRHVWLIEKTDRRERARRVNRRV